MKRIIFVLLLSAVVWGLRQFPISHEIYEGNEPPQTQINGSAEEEDNDGLTPITMAISEPGKEGEENEVEDRQREMSGNETQVSPPHPNLRKGEKRSEENSKEMKENPLLIKDHKDNKRISNEYIKTRIETEGEVKEGPKINEIEARNKSRIEKEKNRDFIPTETVKTDEDPESQNLGEQGMMEEEGEHYSSKTNKNGKPLKDKKQSTSGEKAPPV